MKQLLVELDSETAAKLERVAPARTRRRSEFVRMAIRRALWDLEEQATREAYERQPDLSEAYFDPSLWERMPAARPRRRRRR